jgi:hypothetical protein
MKRFLARLTSPLALLVLAAIAAEGILRAVEFEYPPAGERGVVWSKDEDRAMRTGASFNHLDPKQLWSPNPGARIPWTKEERVNAEGYRGPVVAKERRPGVMRVVTLGSCAAFGRGLAYEDTYSAGLERYREIFREYHPDVVISSFCGYKEHDSAPRFECDGKRIKAWRANPGRSPCRAHGWSPRRDLRIVQLPIWLLRVFDGTYWEERSIDFEEYRLRAEVKEYDAPVVRRVSLAEFEEALSTLAREVKADGGHLMVVNVPNNLSQVKQSPVVEMYGPQLRDFSQRERLVHVNGREVIRRAAQEGTPAADLFDAEGFPSACAHDLLAQALADAIVEHMLELTR